MDSQARLFLARIHRIPILVSKYFEVSMDMAPNTYQIHLFDSFCFHHFVTKQGESISETAIRGNSRRCWYPEYWVFWVLRLRIFVAVVRPCTNCLADALHVWNWLASIPYHEARVLVWEKHGKSICVCNNQGSIGRVLFLWMRVGFSWGNLCWKHGIRDTERSNPGSRQTSFSQGCKYWALSRSNQHKLCWTSVCLLVLVMSANEQPL